ncbi:hypothetical protein WDU94_005573 [Cyamophila willieti]
MYNVNPTILTPTRTTSVRSSCIDNILVNFSPNLILNDKKNFFTGLGDHQYAQVISFKVNNLTECKKVLTRTFPPTRIEKFKHDLARTDFSSIYSTNDVNIQMSNFYDLFLNLFNKYFPRKMITVSARRKKRWITRGIVVSSAKKRQLFNFCKYSVDPSLLEHYRKYSRILAQVVRAAKRMDAIHQIRKAPRHKKSKTIWNIVRSYSKSNSSQQSQIRLVQDGREVRNPHSVAEAFNDFFINVPLQALNQHSVISVSQPLTLATPSSSLYITPANNTLPITSNLLTTHNLTTPPTTHCTPAFTTPPINTHPITTHSTPPLTTHPIPSLTTHPTTPFTTHPTPPITTHPTPPFTSHPTPLLSTHPTPPFTTHPTPPFTTHPTPPLITHATPPFTTHPTPPLTIHTTPPPTTHPNPSPSIQPTPSLISARSFSEYLSNYITFYRFLFPFFFLEFQSRADERRGDSQNSQQF